MAEENFIRRVCDYCENAQNFSQKELTPAQAADVPNWITLARVHIVKGQAYPVMKHACKDSCASNILTLGMLGLPKQVTDMLAEEKRQAELAEKAISAVACPKCGEQDLLKHVGGGEIQCCKCGNQFKPAMFAGVPARRRDPEGETEPAKERPYDA